MLVSTIAITGCQSKSEPLVVAQKVEMILPVPPTLNPKPVGHFLKTEEELIATESKMLNE